MTKSNTLSEKAGKLNLNTTRSSPRSTKGSPTSKHSDEERCEDQSDLNEPSNADLNDEDVSQFTESGDDETTGQTALDGQDDEEVVALDISEDELAAKPKPKPKPRARKPKTQSNGESSPLEDQDDDDVNALEPSEEKPAIKPKPRARKPKEIKDPLPKLKSPKPKPTKQSEKLSELTQSESSDQSALNSSEDEDVPFWFELAKSNRAKCKSSSCSSPQILKDSVKFCYRRGLFTVSYHLECMKAFKTKMQEYGVGFKNLVGYDLLDSKTKASLKKF